MRIVFDHPSRRILSEIGRWIGRLAGSLLVVIGLLATVLAIPGGLVTLADVLNHFQTPPEQLFEPDFPLRAVEAGFVLTVVIAVVALRSGRNLIRGRRSIVLFLRRFGYDGSMQVVTYAVANTIGTSWRLVTLDDDEIAPVGVDITSRVIMHTGERVVRLATNAYKLVLTVFPWAVWGMAGVVGLQVLQVAPDWERLLRDGTVDRYAAIFAAVMERRLPVEYFAWSLSGAFAVFATVLGIALVGLLIGFVVMLAMIPFFGVVMFATSSAEALRKAEQDKTATIKGLHEIAPIVSRLSEAGRQTFAPRLVVVRVTSGIWQETVSALAAVASATIVDISEPTVNLAWEMGELDRLGEDHRCIFIADHARVDEWSPNPNVAAGALRNHLASIIGDREVLAYTTDRRGMRRFARALEGMLLDTTTS
jgi:hypothetical protein